MRTWLVRWRTADSQLLLILQMYKEQPFSLHTSESEVADESVKPRAKSEWVSVQVEIGKLEISLADEREKNERLPLKHNKVVVVGSTMAVTFCHQSTNWI